MTETKVQVRLSDEDGNVETLWADPLGNDRYRLDNTPWYAYRVSCGDIIEVRPDEGGLLVSGKVVERSGYRTVRLIVKVVGPPLSGG